VKLTNLTANQVRLLWNICIIEENLMVGLIIFDQTVAELPLVIEQDIDFLAVIKRMLRDAESYVRIRLNPNTWIVIILSCPLMRPFTLASYGSFRKISVTTRFDGITPLLRVIC
jgi:hypothetical protein